MDDGGVEFLNAAATRIQKLYRSRAARQLSAQLAASIYRKCFDASTGLYYYCNLKTGETAWDRPKIFGDGDAPLYDTPSLPLVELEDDGMSADPRNDLNMKPEMDQGAIPVTELTLVQRKQESMEKLERVRQEGREIIQLKAQVKLELEQKHRKKVHRGRKNWDKEIISHQEQARQIRLNTINQENKQTIQDLMEGKHKPQLESFREACMRGNVERVKQLLADGWNANAESAMGLTPLFAACIGGHVEVVKLLLYHNAHVNHRHIVTQRTAYMEACQRTNTSIVCELLRYGAYIHVKDKQGRVASDGITNKQVQEMHQHAAGIWTTSSAYLYPNSFRAAGLMVAFVMKCQRRESLRNKEIGEKEAEATRIKLQKKLIQIKAQVIQSKRRTMTIEADNSFDSARDAILQQAEAAILQLKRRSQLRCLTESNVISILSFCQRHWFDSKSKLVVRQGQRVDSPQPSRLWQSHVHLPPQQAADLAQSMKTIESMSAELKYVEDTQKIDTESGVSVDITTGMSQAQLCITIVEGINLPKRANRSMIDPYVRVRLHGEDGKILTEFESTDPRFEEENPSWEHPIVIQHVPSIRCDLLVQVMDTGCGRPELAGEIRIPLRKYIDQKDHDEWHVLPQTLKQTMVEGKSRVVPAKIRLILQFTHAKQLILTREISKATKQRQEFLQQKRKYIQDQLNQVLTNRLQETKESFNHMRAPNSLTHCTIDSERCDDLDSSTSQSVCASDHFGINYAFVVKVATTSSMTGSFCDMDRGSRRTTTRENTGCGFLFGLVFLAAAVIGLFLNEGNAVRKYVSLHEGLDNVVYYESTSKMNFNSKLMHLNGRITTKNEDEFPIVMDPEFGIALRGVHLHRIVEMLQWEEQRHDHTYTENGQEKTDTTYSYRKTWSSEPIQSIHFDDASYVNPTSWVYEPKKITASPVFVHGYELPTLLTDKITYQKDISLSKSNLLEMASTMEMNLGLKQNIKQIPALKSFQIQHDQFVQKHKGKSARAAIGDLRVKFKVTPANAVSIVAMPMDGILYPYRTSNGESIALLEEGLVPAQEMFENARSDVTIMTWIYRLVGIFIAFLGFNILLQPIVDLAYTFLRIPIAGRLLVNVASYSVDIISFLLGLSLSLVVIAIAWVFYRPLVAFGLLLVAITPYFRSSPPKDVYKSEI